MAKSLGRPENKTLDTVKSISKVPERSKLRLRSRGKKEFQNPPTNKILVRVITQLAGAIGTRVQNSVSCLTSNQCLPSTSIIRSEMARENR